LRLVTNDPHHLLNSEDPLEHLDALYRVALRLTRRAAEAEDLVQETYLRAFSAAERLKVGTRLRPWLFRVLRNAFLDRLRRESRSPFDDEADPEESAELGDQGGNLLRGDAELDRLRSVVGEEIEAALQALPEGMRSVVLLDLEGLGESEIGEILGCAPGTVKSRLHRARLALRRQLADYRR